MGVYGVLLSRVGLFATDGAPRLFFIANIIIGFGVFSQNFTLHKFAVLKILTEIMICGMIILRKFAFANKKQQEK